VSTPSTSAAADEHARHPDSAADVHSDAGSRARAARASSAPWGTSPVGLIIGSLIGAHVVLLASDSARSSSAFAGSDAEPATAAARLKRRPSIRSSRVAAA